MQCPKCYGTDVTLIDNSHYVCNNRSCVDSKGHQTQFKIKNDEKIKFPYNEIFLTRNTNDFYRKIYIQ